MIGGFLFPPTWLHRAPAGAKLLALAVAATICFSLGTWQALAAALVSIVALYGSLGRRALVRLKSLRAVAVPIALIYALQWFFAGHETAFVSVARLLAMILLADIVTMTTPLQAMLDALTPVFRLLRPIGVDGRKLALAVSLVIRFIPLMLALWARRNEAWRARSARRVSPRQIALFIADSLRNADRIAEALDARGYDRKTP